MPLRRNRQNRLLVQNGEKHLLQSLATATVAPRKEIVMVVTSEGAKYCTIVNDDAGTHSVEAFRKGFAQRQKKSSATMLRRKLSQTSLKRDLQEI
ncbi:TPA: hypothetical protein ACJI3N_005333 [Raoultella planticola]